MAWIHIGDVRFRNPLPHSGKMRYVTAQNGSQKGISQTSTAPSSASSSLLDLEHLITKGNVPTKFQWTQVEKNDGNDVKTTNKDGVEKDESNNAKDDNNESGVKFWAMKDTSCDVELDTIGMNVNYNVTSTRTVQDNCTGFSFSTF